MSFGDGSSDLNSVNSSDFKSVNIDHEHYYQFNIDKEKEAERLDNYFNELISNFKIDATNIYGLNEDQHFKEDKLNDEGKDIIKDKIIKNYHENLKKAYEKFGLTKFDIGDMIAEMLFPSVGARKAGRWIQEQIFGSSDFTKNLEERGNDGWFSIFDPADALVSSICKSRSSDFFEETSSNRFSGGQWPSLSLNSMLYIYGTKKEYQDENWFPDNEGNPLGYLYTFSWNFNHPYSQSQVDELSSSERRDKGLGDETGNIYYRIITVLEDDDEKRGKIWDVAPSGTSHNSLSFYSTDNIKKIYIYFINNYEHRGEKRFPNPSEISCGSNSDMGDHSMGCIKTMDTSVLGRVPSSNNPSSGSGSAGGSPVPVGVGTSGVGGSDSDDCGDYDCLF